MDTPVQLSDADIISALSDAKSELEFRLEEYAASGDERGLVLVGKARKLVRAVNESILRADARLSR